jgi:hypothetical protein
VIVAIGIVFVMFFAGCSTHGEIVTPEGDRLRGSATLTRQVLEVPEGSTLTMSRDTTLTIVNAETKDPVADARAAAHKNKPFMYAGLGTLLLGAILLYGKNWLTGGALLGASGGFFYLWRNPEAFDWVVLLIVAASALTMYLGWTLRQTQKEEE